MRIHKKKNQLLIITLVVGFLVGIIYQNILSSRGDTSLELLLASNLQRCLQVHIITEKYVWYVIKSRVLAFVFVCSLSCIKQKKIFVTISLFMLSFFAGILLVSAVLQFGINGFLLFLAGIFPQGIFYGMAASMLFVYWFQYPTCEWNRTKTVFLLFMILTGILVETYVNPTLVQGVIRLL